MSDDIPELNAEDFAHAMPHRQRQQILAGKIRPEDIAALRRFVRLSQKEFADALQISVHTLRNWEQGRRRPEGPAIALLRIVSRHPRLLRENMASPA